MPSSLAFARDDGLQPVTLRPWRPWREECPNPQISTPDSLRRLRKTQGAYPSKISDPRACVVLNVLNGLN